MCAKFRENRTETYEETFDDIHTYTQTDRQTNTSNTYTISYDGQCYD